MALCSIGIAAGILGVVMIVKGIIRRRRFGGPWAYAACGPGFGPCGSSYGPQGDGDGPWGFGPRWRGGFGRRFGALGQSFWLRRVFARLDATPGQEREIRAALEDLQRTAFDAKDSLRASREQVAQAIASENFDEGAAERASARVDIAVEQAKDAFTSALRRVHAVLDPKQRERLAELIAKGPGIRRGFGMGGPYRGGSDPDPSGGDSKN